MNNDKVREALRASMYSAANSGWSGDAIAVDIDAAVDVALEYIEKPQWQPIETAPKDGTEILIFQPAFEKYGVKSWQRERIAVVSWQHFGWSIDHVSGAECEDDFDYAAVTHWQPLPNPPEKK